MTAEVHGQPHLAAQWRERTRGGYECRIYASDGGGELRYHGAVYMSHSGWYPCAWHDDGRFDGDPVFDLIPRRA